MQSVYLGRRDHQSIEIEKPEIRLPIKPGSKTTFDIDLINCDAPTHVYLSARGAIKDKITFNRNNPYVDGEELLTATVANPLGDPELFEGEILVSTGYGSREGSFILQIGQRDDEQPLDAIDIDEDLARPDYRSKARPVSVRAPSINLQLPQVRFDARRVKTMTNLPYILLGIGVIIALMLLAAGAISYGVAILGFIIVVVLAYYTWRLLD